jgi:flagellar basal-body rod modification protein FlgD
MTGTDPLGGLGELAGSAASTAKARDRLGQREFLQLMIAQFRNQDPTKPKDPSEFLGQLAQFSTVSGIQDMQSSIGVLSDALRSQNVLGGSVLVGREVMAAESDIAYTAGDAVTGAIEVPEGVSTVEMTIKDAAGQLIRRVNVPVRTGLNEFSWDGVTDRGTAAGSGTYSIEATARFGAANESLQVMLNTRVNSVTIDPQTHGLTLNTRGLGAVAIGDVRRVM